jgi:N-acetylglucosaminyldiphosphoundecaprenol N-acetyl-beta-D-mannosaminyltransferase
VFLLGAKPGVGEKAAQNIEKRWPGVRITGIYSPPFGFEKSDIECKRMIDVVNAARPQLLVIGLSPPKQEIWIAQSIEQLDINVAVCAGATIDFLAGTVLRAPRWMQVAGMEWVFRILTEPTRLGPRYAVDGIKFLRILIREWRAASRN